MTVLTKRGIETTQDAKKISKLDDGKEEEQSESKTSQPSKTLQPYPYGNGPSCFHGYEIRLEDFIDLEKYPIHDLKSPLRKELVRQCRVELQKSAVCLLPSFITPNAVKEMAAEATRCMAKRTKQSGSFITAYLSPANDEFAEDHPRNILQHRTQSFIDSCLLEEQSFYRKFYDSDVVLHFISECIEERIYRWPCPIARSVYSVMEDGNYLPWHFDRNPFTVSLLVQDAVEGGEFEYCPNLRHHESGVENYNDVKDVLQGTDRSKVQILPLKCGDIQIFRGENTLHRVTPCKGDIPRLIALPSYVKDPYYVGMPKDVDLFYGKHFPIHEERKHIVKLGPDEYTI